MRLSVFTVFTFAFALFACVQLQPSRRLLSRMDSKVLLPSDEMPRLSLLSAVLAESSSGEVHALNGAPTSVAIELTIRTLNQIHERFTSFIVASSKDDQEKVKKAEPYLRRLQQAVQMLQGAEKPFDKNRIPQTPDELPYVFSCIFRNKNGQRHAMFAQITAYQGSIVEYLRNRPKYNEYQSVEYMLTFINTGMGIDYHPSLVTNFKKKIIPYLTFTELSANSFVAFEKYFEGIKNDGHFKEESSRAYYLRLMNEFAAHYDPNGLSNVNRAHWYIVPQISGSCHTSSIFAWLRYHFLSTPNGNVDKVGFDEYKLTKLLYKYELLLRYGRANAKLKQTIQSRDDEEKPIIKSKEISFMADFSTRHIPMLGVEGYVRDIVKMLRKGTIKYDEATDELVYGDFLPFSRGESLKLIVKDLRQEARNIFEGPVERLNLGMLNSAYWKYPFAFSVPQSIQNDMASVRSVFGEAFTVVLDGPKRTFQFAKYNDADLYFEKVSKDIFIVALDKIKYKVSPVGRNFPGFMLLLKDDRELAKKYNFLICGQHVRGFPVTKPTKCDLIPAKEALNLKEFTVGSCLSPELNAWQSAALSYGFLYERDYPNAQNFLLDVSDNICFDADTFTILESILTYCLENDDDANAYAICYSAGIILSEYQTRRKEFCASKTSPYISNFYLRTTLAQYLDKLKSSLTNYSQHTYRLLSLMVQSKPLLDPFYLMNEKNRAFGYFMPAESLHAAELQTVQSTESLKVSEIDIEAPKIAPKAEVVNIMKRLAKIKVDHVPSFERLDDLGLIECDKDTIWYIAKHFIDLGETLKMDIALKYLPKIKDYLLESLTETSDRYDKETLFVGFFLYDFLMRNDSSNIKLLIEVDGKVDEYSAVAYSLADEGRMLFIKPLVKTLVQKDAMKPIEVEPEKIGEFFNDQYVNFSWRNYSVELLENYDRMAALVHGNDSLNAKLGHCRISLSAMLETQYALHRKESLLEGKMIPAEQLQFKEISPHLRDVFIKSMQADSPIDYLHVVIYEDQGYNSSWAFTAFARYIRACLGIRLHFLPILSAAQGLSDIDRKFFVEYVKEIRSSGDAVFIPSFAFNFFVKWFKNFTSKEQKEMGFPEEKLKYIFDTASKYELKQEEKVIADDNPDEEYADFSKFIK
jgi:hypothetical protein